MIRDNTRACVELGLVVPDGDDITLADEACWAFQGRGYDSEAARLLLARLICSTGNDANHDLCAAMAWFLAGDPLTQDTGFDSVGNALRAAGSADLLGMRAQLRYDQVVYWAIYLGLAYRTQRPDGELVPVFDPTSHMARVMPNYLCDQGKRGVPIAQFCDQLARDWPVYPGGQFSDRIADLCTTREPSTLPPSLWVGISRLNSRGCVKLTRLADADMLVFPGGGVTHVAWTGPGKSRRQAQ